MRNILSQEIDLKPVRYIKYSHLSTTSFGKSLIKVLLEHHYQSLVSSPVSVVFSKPKPFILQPYIYFGVSHSYLQHSRNCNKQEENKIVNKQNTITPNRVL
jgi:hypothetical protein